MKMTEPYKRAHFLVKLHECPKCGKNGVWFGHFGVSKTSYGWMGLKCTKCGWTQKDEGLTRKMLIDNRKLKEYTDKIIKGNENK